MSDSSEIKEHKFMSLTGNGNEINTYTITNSSPVDISSTIYSTDYYTFHFEDAAMNSDLKRLGWHS